MHFGRTVEIGPSIVCVVYVLVGKMASGEWKEFRKCPSILGVVDVVAYGHLGQWSTMNSPVVPKITLPMLNSHFVKSAS